ncbi:hypothetical protein SAMN04488003_101297 [Loktanella fryxellensis]|uniref:Glycosyl transferase family 8 n=1 Tax=Loktanella fryxellensis TaxID=245187 RepID=A0A1H7YUT0_9RHOB|nr:hypothetical protein [Loktanella fryxellensis]SEM49138.1 hypothetical protein SAMN04488003_101297 [Loktanella fryxellensis]
MTGPRPDIGMTGPRPDIGMTGPGPDIGMTGPSPDIGMTGPSPDIGMTGPGSDIGMKPASPAPVPVIACFKWGAGYPAADTNVLFRALRDLMGVPHRFVCVTDDGTGLDDGIEVLPLPAFALPHGHWTPGMWPKLAIFAPGLFADGTPVLLMDVDVMVLRDLAPLVDRVRAQPGLHIIRDWPNLTERVTPWRAKGPRLSNSSVVGFTAGTQGQIWDAFHTAGWDTLAPQVNDQDFIHHHAQDRLHWPDGWVLSFKKSVVWHVPLNYLAAPARPREAFVVAFHGKPDMADLLQAPGVRWGTKERFGRAPVPWVMDYQRRYGDAPPA